MSTCLVVVLSEWEEMRFSQPPGAEKGCLPVTDAGARGPTLSLCLSPHGTVSVPPLAEPIAEGQPLPWLTACAKATEALGTTYLVV